MATRRAAYNILVGKAKEHANLKEIDHKENQSMDVQDITVDVKDSVGRVWTGLIWISGGLL